MTLEDRLEKLRGFGRLTEAIQIITLMTFGQYLYGGGAQQLSAKHWQPARDFFGSYQGVGNCLMFIAFIGLLGLFSSAFTWSARAYPYIMWAYSLSAAAWFITVGITHALARSGSTGLWSLGMAGLWFLTTRIAVQLAAPIHRKEKSA
ncbi:membrane protein [Mycobacterium phage ScoobyDoobyDoo]|nr:membrane protein [Mycobacterium phage ScoobyDoobyDoo]